MPTEPRNESGPVARGLLTRFGDYIGNLTGSEAQYPPDVITTQPYPRLSVNAGASGCSMSSPCIQEGNNGPIVTAGNIDSLGLFAYNAYEASLIKRQYTNPPPTGQFNRRVLSVPVGNCSGSAGGSSSIPIIGFACFFLLQQPIQQGNSLLIVGQYLGDCNADNARDRRLAAARSRASSSAAPATARKPRPVKSPPVAGVDKEVEDLVQELRGLPADMPPGVCSLCNAASKVSTERRREVNDRVDALGSAAVPELAQMLQRSLAGMDDDLRDTSLRMLAEISHPYTARDGKEHEKNDISAAVPALILALDDRVAGAGAARLLGAIGPKAAPAVPKLLAMLGDVSDMVRADACRGLEGIDVLPALRQARSDPSVDKKQFAQQAVAEIEQKCFVEPMIHSGSRCDAPPYGDTPAAYKAFAQPYVSISLGPPNRLLRDMCHMKFDHWNHSTLHDDVSDEDFDKLGTVALVERQLAAMVTHWKMSQHACGSNTGIHTGPPCFGREKGADAPADLLLCFEPPGETCRHIPETPPTPISTMLECQELAGFLSQNGPSQLTRVFDGVKYGYTDGRYLVQGASAWYECRSKYLDTVEPSGFISYRQITSDAVWVQIDSRFPLYVDTSSIAIRGDKRRAWFQRRFPPHSYRSDAEKSVAAESTMWDFSCATKEVRLVGSNETLDDGSNRRGGVDWSPIEVRPGTLVDLEMQYLCRLH